MKYRLKSCRLPEGRLGPPKAAKSKIQLSQRGIPFSSFASRAHTHAHTHTHTHTHTRHRQRKRRGRERESARARERARETHSEGERESERERGGEREKERKRELLSHALLPSVTTVVAKTFLDGSNCRCEALRGCNFSRIAALSRTFSDALSAQFVAGFLSFLSLASSLFSFLFSEPESEEAGLKVAALAAPCVASSPATYQAFSS